MKKWVLDTSAIVRLYVPDGPLPEGLEDAVETAWRGDGLLLVPELALAEAAQVLLKKERSGLLEPGEVDGILGEIMGLPLEVAPHRELLPTSLGLARRTDLTVYDAIFLQLALERGAELLTADEELARAFRAPRTAREPA